SAARDPGRRAEGPRRADGGSGRPYQAPLDGGEGDARRTALSGPRRRGPATTHATSAPALDDRREWSADAADRRAGGADRRVRPVAESAGPVDSSVAHDRLRREAHRDPPPGAPVLGAR